MWGHTIASVNWPHWPNWPRQHFACQAFSHLPLCAYKVTPMDKLLRILFLTDCSIWRPESSTEMMREATRYKWLIYLSLSSCFPIKPNNLARSVARVYADISLRYLFWRQCLYRPVLEWQLLTRAFPNSCSLFNRESVWSLIWTCCSQDASVPITSPWTKEMVGQNCPFVITGKHTATLSLANDSNCQH